MADRPVIALIGAGNTGTFLIERLHLAWNLIVVDLEISKIERLKKKYSSNIAFFQGDATSFLVLKKAEIETAYQVIVTVQDDEAASEIISLLSKRFNKKNIIVRIHNVELAANLKSEGINIVNPFETMANYIVNEINLGETIALNIGKGEGEIVQIELLNTSPIAGKKLKSLPPRKWIVGAIYRPRQRIVKKTESANLFRRFKISVDDELIIPSGEVKLKVGDKLILIGDPHILRATAQYLKAGAPVFPQRHGSSIMIMFLDSSRNRKGFRQLLWMFHSMEPSNIKIVYHDNNQLDNIQRFRLPESWKKKGKHKKEIYQVRRRNIKGFIDREVRKERIGLVVYSEPEIVWKKLLHRYYLFPLFNKILRKKDTPIWIIRGNCRIRRVVLYVTSDEEIFSMAELAIDAAIKFNLPFYVIQVNTPGIITGVAQKKAAEERLYMIGEIAAMYGIKTEKIIKEGNPVSETLKALNREDLLVLIMKKSSIFSFLIPNVPQLLVARYPGSVLFLNK